MVAEMLNHHMFKKLHEERQRFEAKEIGVQKIISKRHICVINCCSIMKTKLFEPCCNR